MSNQPNQHSGPKVLPEVGKAYRAYIYDQPLPQETVHGEAVQVPIQVDDVITSYGPFQKRFIFGREIKGKTKHLLRAAAAMLKDADGLPRADWGAIENKWIGVIFKDRPYTDSNGVDQMDVGIEEILTVQEVERREEEAERAAPRAIPAPSKPKGGTKAKGKA